ncbi:MAG: indolepyruvate oxidoreductase subunit beta [Clostridiales Family XIII bacterium]|jgi:indolepyruvate ferredoxin oxidoreductase beta subunit|nr:indolepyruvate oxidoreductase subunit beta [Clostridiales Family XIII bacterium]
MSINKSAAGSILLVGVGGQGTILASKILSQGLMDAGFDVKMSEIHGMSQRGGSVSTQIRFADDVASPIIGLGEADLIIAFEKMEALRWLDHLKPSGTMIINNFEIPSVPILLGEAKYPEGIIADLKEKVDAKVVDAATIADNLGNAKAMNIVLLGAAVRAISKSERLQVLNDIDWDHIIQEIVKPQFVELNIKAFHAA